MITAEVLKWPDNVSYFADNIKGNPTIMYTNKNISALLPIAPADNATVTVSNTWSISKAPNINRKYRFLTIHDKTGYEYILFAASDNSKINTAVTLRNGQPYVSSLSILGPTIYHYMSQFTL